MATAQEVLQGINQLEAAGQITPQQAQIARQEVARRQRAQQSQSQGSGQLPVGQIIAGGRTAKEIFDFVTDLTATPPATPDVISVGRVPSQTAPPAPPAPTTSPWRS